MFRAIVMAIFRNIRL